MHLNLQMVSITKLLLDLLIQGDILTFSSFYILYSTKSPLRWPNRIIRKILHNHWELEKAPSKFLNSWCSEIRNGTRKKKRWKENVDHPTIYIFQRGLQIMVAECIGVEFQSCCSQSGATSAYNTCLEREVGRAALCMEQKILLHQLLLTSVSWQWELKAKYSQPAEDCHSRWPTGRGNCSPQKTSQVCATFHYLPCTSNYIKSTKKRCQNFPFFYLE